MMLLLHLLPVHHAYTPMHRLESSPRAEPCQQGGGLASARDLLRSGSAEAWQHCAVMHCQGCSCPVAPRGLGAGLKAKTCYFPTPGISSCISSHHLVQLVAVRCGWEYETALESIVGSCGLAVQ